MTTPTNPSDDNKAKAFFTGALLLGAGFAGLAVAGIVLGFDYLLHGEPHERERLNEIRNQRRKDRHLDAVAWLENDRLDRERYRQARRDWFNADPATRGDAPSSGETFGRAMGRAWNNLLVGGRRFRNGWNQGRADAQERREQDTPQWWRRPGQPETPGPTPTTKPETTAPPPASHPKPAPGTFNPGGPDIVDAEIIPDPQPATHDIVPAGKPTPERGPDEALEDYQRRLDALNEPVAASNGHHPYA